MRYSGKRKVHQRRINKIIHKMNKAIIKDELWNGRFYARTVETQWQSWYNTSDYSLYVMIVLSDKITGITKNIGWFRVDDYFIESKLFWSMNNFIIEDVDVWDKNKHTLPEWYRKNSKE